MPLPRLLPLILLALWLTAGAAPAEPVKDAPSQADDRLKDRRGPRDAPPATSAASGGDEQPGDGGLSQDEARAGIREALALGVQQAVSQLGRKDGFLGDPEVRIGSPKALHRLTDMARSLGAGKYVDAFEASMNRAAEAAVPLAAETFAEAVSGLSMQDAIGLVRDGDGAATRYLREKTGDRLRERFLPVVARSTAEAGVIRHYAQLSEKTGEMGSVLGSDVDLDRYITDKAIDGLFHYVAEQETDIRADPLGQASSLLQRVFGKG